MEDDSSSADDADGNEFEILPAEDGQLKYICKIATMAGTQRKDALDLMKKLIGVSKDQETYILDTLIKMARPDPNPKTSNPYAKKKGRRTGGKNLEGHNAGRPKKKPAAGQQQLSFASRNEDQSAGNSNNNSTSSNSNTTFQASQQAAAATKAAQEEEHYKAAIGCMEKFVESIPNGSFTTCIPVLADDEDGLELDFDSDEEGDGDNGDDGGDGGGDGNSNHKKRKKRRCYKPKIGSAIHTYMDCILIKVKTRHPSIIPLCDSSLSLVSLVLLLGLGSLLCLL